MKHSMIKKLRGQAGESIAETLIALLISALALVMLAGAISTVANSNTKMMEYYRQDAALASQTGGSGESITINIAASDSSLSETRENTQLFINSAFQGTQVVSYAAPAPSAGPGA